MRLKSNVLWGWLLVMTLVWGGQVQAQAPSLDEQIQAIFESLTAGNGVVFGTDSFEGDWADKKQWKGRLCNGKQSYHAQVSGRIHDLSFENSADGSMLVFAELRDIVGIAAGSYQSVYSACLPLSGSFPFQTEFLKAKVKTSFVNEAGTTKIRISILETKLGRLRITSSALPDFMERSITRFANAALQVVWRSSLGHWLSGYISDQIEKRAAQ